jgi:Nuf2 family
MDFCSGFPCGRLMQDLTKPDEHRLRRQLSALVNFARFRETKLEVYLTWQQETDTLLEQQAALSEANAKLVHHTHTPRPCWSSR